MSRGNEESVFAEERKHLIVELVNKQVKTTVAQLCDEFKVSPATVRNDLRELEFAGLLKRTHGGAISNRKTNYEPTFYEKLVERIAAYIDNCAESEFPDLTVLSEAFGVTPQYISNVFKKYRDENVKDYIARRKLAQAKALLTGTDLPVREVAARLGYAGEIGIIRLFRKYEGTTPGDYRAQHK